MDQTQLRFWPNNNEQMTTLRGRESERASVTSSQKAFGKNLIIIG
jgi:hypothetical protein